MGWKFQASKLWTSGINMQIQSSLLPTPQSRNHIAEYLIFKIFHLHGLHPWKTGDDFIRISFKTILICFHSLQSKNWSFYVGLGALKGLGIIQSVIVAFFVATLIVQWIVISQLEFKLNPNPSSFLYIYNSNLHPRNALEHKTLALLTTALTSGFWECLC